MGMSAAHCQGNVTEFQSVWRVVTLCQTDNKIWSAVSSRLSGQQQRKPDSWM